MKHFDFLLTITIALITLALLVNIYAIQASYY